MNEEFFKIETHPNRDIVTYHVRCALMEHEKYKDKYDRKETILRKTKLILQSIKEVSGIEDAYCHNMYSLSVEKGQAFTWAELNPKIMEIIYSLKRSQEKKKIICLQHIKNDKRRRSDAPCICGKSFSRDPIEFLLEVNRTIYEVCK